MDAEHYLLSEAADRVDLLAWAQILPPGARILRTSLFGDVFLLDAHGAVHMLERGACSVSQIASSEREFWHSIDDDEEGWQLRPLADACRDAGKILGDGQCYAFLTLPLFGGNYVPQNVWVAPWQEWFGLTADLFQQTKDLPDGAAVTLKVVD